MLEMAIIVSSAFIRHLLLSTLSAMQSTLAKLLVEEGIDHGISMELTLHLSRIDN